LKVDDHGRAEVLRAVIALRGDFGPLARELASFGWDWPADEPLVVLTRRDVIAVIDRFLAGGLSAGDLESWAECLECRDDLGYEDGNERRKVQAVFWLANPEINAALTPEWVSEVRAGLA